MHLYCTLNMRAATNNRMQAAVTTSRHRMTSLLISVLLTELTFVICHHSNEEVDIYSRYVPHRGLLKPASYSKTDTEVITVFV